MVLVSPHGHSHGHSHGSARVVDANVRVVEHNTFHHNVPQLLQQQGELVPLLKDEMLRVLRAVHLQLELFSLSSQFQLQHQR